MIYIQPYSVEGQGDVDNALLERAVRQTLQHVGADPDVDVTVVLGDDEQLQRLNRQFLGVDAPTDVLAFPGCETDPDSQVEYLGDVIISCESALAQSTAGGHSLEDELQLLIVHGVLHLLEYDHTADENKAAMWAAQAEILALLGCSITGPNT